jgi:hypothetical protein
MLYQKRACISNDVPSGPWMLPQSSTGPALRAMTVICVSECVVQLPATMERDLYLSVRSVVLRPVEASYQLGCERRPRSV